jgi:methylated-DNA-protein-cysteine methyltransferase related protein
MPSTSSVTPGTKNRYSNRIRRSPRSRWRLCTRTPTAASTRRRPRLGAGTAGACAPELIWPWVYTGGLTVRKKVIGTAIPSSSTRGKHLPTSPIARLEGVIAAVPRGMVITYGQAATLAGFPGAARLTVRALRYGTGLPWHRVVGAGGRIALAGEDGREQRLRLEIEGVSFQGGRVRLDLHGWTPRTRTGSKPRPLVRGARGSRRAGGRPGSPDPDDDPDARWDVTRRG